MSANLNMTGENGETVTVAIEPVKPAPKTVEYYALISVEFKRPIGPGSWAESHAYFGHTFERDADKPVNRSSVFPWLVDQFWEHNPAMANRWERNEMKVLFFDVNRNEL